MLQNLEFGARSKRRNRSHFRLTRSRNGAVVREPHLKRYFAYLVLAAMALGVLAGFILNQTLSPAAAKDAA